MLPDHPPISIIAYAVVGRFYLENISDSDDTGLLAHSIWMRAPAITADVITLVALFSLMLRWKNWRWATIAGIVHALSPGVIGDSAIWGQIDSVFTMWIVLALVAFARSWWVMFAMCYALALFSKAQAIALLPFMTYLFLFRVPFVSQLKAVGGVAIVTAIIWGPFVVGGVLPEVIHAYTGAVGHYAALSMNALNFWWLLYPVSTDTASTQVAIAGLTFRHIGFILYLAYSLFAIYLYKFVYLPKVATRKISASNEVIALFGVATLTFFAFFTFNTEMHERYLFPACVLALPLLAAGWRLCSTSILVNVLVWLNIAGVIRISAVDEWIFSTYPNARSVIALFVVLGCVAYGIFLRQSFTQVLPRKRVQK